MRVVFFGTPPFAANILSYLLEKGVEVVAAVTRPDKPRGRSGHPHPSAVKDLLSHHLPKIPLHQPEKASTDAFIEQLKVYEADLFIVVAYGEILKQGLLDLPKMACINIHASLLPKYRGAAPIQHAIINGEKETGITIMHMVRKMDAGAIIQSARCNISPNASYGDVEKQLVKIASPLLLDVIHDFAKGKVKERAQDEAAVTFAPKIEVADCAIDWNRPANVLHNLIRGVSPKPGAWCYVNVRKKKLRLKVLQSSLLSQKGTPGELLSFGKAGIAVACGEGALQLDRVQLEGKRAMSGQELAQGFSFKTFSLSREDFFSKK